MIDFGVPKGQRVPSVADAMRVFAGYTPSLDVSQFHRHWYRLHSMPFVATDWEREYLDWVSSIPTSCGCGSDWTSRKLPAVPAGVRERLQWTVDRHNEINRELGKIGLSYSVAEREYHPYGGFDADPQQHAAGRLHDLVAVTAISTRHSIARQRFCLRSWLAQGIKAIVACNTRDEIAAVRSHFPEIEFRESQAGQSNSYATQRISTLAHVAIALDRPILIINSDVEMRGTDWIRFSDYCAYLGIRWNYEMTCPHELTEFEWGIDAVTLTPKQAAFIPHDWPYQIGQPMWDYACPELLRKKNIQLLIPHSPFLLHENHAQNWSESDWWLGTQWAHSTAEKYRDGSFRRSLDPGLFYDGFRYRRKSSLRRSS